MVKRKPDDDAPNEQGRPPATPARDAAAQAAPEAQARDLAKALRQALADPFHPDEVKWKPQATKGDRAMAVAYVDARAVMDRLDDVLGVDGWHDKYPERGDGAISCVLTLRMPDGSWLAKQDVGGKSEQPDEDDQRKAGFSDALKRAAVKWGIGRYLYHLPRKWLPYDQQRRRFTETPTLPAWALPGAKTPPPPPPPVPAAPEEPQPAAAESYGPRPSLTAAQREAMLGDLERHVAAANGKPEHVVRKLKLDPAKVTCAMLTDDQLREALSWFEAKKEAS